MPMLRFLFRMSLLGAAVLAIAAFEAKAVPMTGMQLEGPRHTYTYSTMATFNNAGTVAGSTPSVSFLGVQGQTVESAAPFQQAGAYPSEITPGAVADFPLGKLVVTLPREGPTIYDSAEFGITVRIEAVDGDQLASPITTVLKGVLNGVVNVTGDSNLSFGLVGESTASSFDPPGGWTAGVFHHDVLTNYILGVSPSMSLDGVHFSTNTDFVLDAKLFSSVPVNTPEPATWAVFALGTLAAWRLTRKRLASPPRRLSVG